MWLIIKKYCLKVRWFIEKISINLFKIVLFLNIKTLKIYKIFN